MKLRKLTSFLCAAALTVSSIAGLSVSVSADETAKNVTVAVNVGDTTARVASGETEELSGVLIHAKYTENVLQSVKVSSEFTTPQNSVDIGFAYAEGDKLFMWNSLSGMVPYKVTVIPNRAQINTVAKVEISGDATAPATLTATVSAINDSGFEETTAFTYEWSKDGGAVSGGTDGTLANAEAGNYTVTATYTGSGNYEGSVTTAAPYIVSQAGDTKEDIAGKVTVSINADKQTAGATLTAEISAGETDLSETDFTYVWSKDGSPILGGENGTLEDVLAGEYTVVATVKPDNTSYKGSTSVSQAVTIKAVYTVIWSVDGETTQESYADGEIPSYSGTPSKAQTDTDTFEFTDWNPAISAVTGDITYTAQFSSQKRSYNVTYNKNEGDIENEANYTSYTCGTALTLPTPTRNGYTFGGWYENSNFDGTEITSIGADAYGNKVYYAQWTPSVADTHTITFNSNGGSAVASQQIEDGQTASEPTPPIREHYTFVEWQLNGEAYDFTSPVTDDITLTAVWRIDSYTVSFDAGTGADAFAGTDASRQVNYNEAVGAAPTLQNVKANYAFAHWLSGQTQYTNDEVAALAVTQPLSFLAKYTITVTLDGNGGTFNSDATKAVPKLEGTALGAVDEPERAHYTFTGWKKGGEDVTDITTEVMNAPVTYIAQWTRIERTVTFNLNGGKVNNSDENVDVKVNDGEKVTAPSVSRDGYTLKGWKKDNADFDFNTEITADITLVADWEEIPLGSYSVSFDLNGAAGSIAAQAVAENGTATAPDPTPTRGGYDFDGWMLNGTAYDFSTPVTSNITLVAKWNIKQYTITFKLNGGTVSGSGNDVVRTVEYNGTVTAPTPEKAASDEYTYEFSGWSPELVTIVTDDAEYIAQYTATKRKYTITWLTDDGSTIDTTQVEYGTTPTHADAEKTATAQYTYTFAGWDTTPVAVTGDATYKATFSASAKTFDITYNINGHGAAPTEKLTYTYAAGLAELPELTETGYTFEGWYTAADGGDKVESITAEEYGDKDLYAHWTIITLTATYAAGYEGGEAPETGTTNISSDNKVTLPAALERDYYTFSKWVDSDGNKYDAQAEVTLTENTTFTAEWTPVEYTITFNGADDATGMDDAPAKYTIETEDITLPTPEKDGFEFAGWYEKENPTEEDTAVETIEKGTTGGKTFYAQWKEILINGSLDPATDTYTWSLKDFTESAVNGSYVDVNTDNGIVNLSVAMLSGDSLASETGTISFSGTAINNSSKTNVAAGGRYLLVTPEKDGELNLTVTITRTTTSRLYYSEVTSENTLEKISKPQTYIANNTASATSGSIPMEANKTYVIYSYNESSGSTAWTITNMSYKVYSNPAFSGAYDGGTYSLSIGNSATGENKYSVTENDYIDITASLANNDTLIKGTGIKYSSASVNDSTSVNESTGRYISVTPKKSGKIVISYTIDSNRRVMCADYTGTADWSKFKKDAVADVTNITDGTNGDIIGTYKITNLGNGSATKIVDAEEGHTYVFYSYYVAFTVTSLQFTVPSEVITGGFDETSSSYNWTMGYSSASTSYTAWPSDNEYADLIVSLGSGDSISNGNINYTNAAVGESSNVTSTGRYMIVTPKSNGTFTVKVNFPVAGNSTKCRFHYVQFDSKEAALAGLTTCVKNNTSFPTDTITSSGVKTVTLSMTGGKSYVIYNYPSRCTISSLSYTNN